MPDNAPAAELEERLHARAASEPATPRVPRSTKVPRERTFLLPCPGRSGRATRDGKRRRTRRVPLSVPPQLQLGLARLPRNPLVEAPESPGPHGRRMANENDWSAPAQRL